MTGALAFIATCDLVAITRGRAVRGEEYSRRQGIGVGWVPADLALTTFGDIAEPNVFGSLGDLRLVPVDAARCTLPALAGRPQTLLVLADTVLPDGQPWECCPRHALASAIDDLERRFGLRLRVTFEQEFGLTGLAGGAPFSVEALRAAEPFGSALVETLHENGLEPETWLPEYGANQFEITLAPADPLTAADRAILLRALVRDMATAHGLRATFAPLVAPGAVGNGVHVHLSLWDTARGGLTLDGASGRLTTEAGRFVAGILGHAPAVVAWTAPSVISPLRFGPHHWSSAAAFLGRQNREAMIRVCPVPTLADARPKDAANLEFRACDATANPWLVMATLIRAGLDGLERKLPAAPIVEGDLEAVGAAERERLGVTAFPADLAAALDALEGDAAARSWFAPDLLATHLGIRRTELRVLADATPEERCARYADVI